MIIRKCVLLFCVLVCRFDLTKGQFKSLHFHIEEGDQKHRFVGNVAKGARLEEDVGSVTFLLLRYSLHSLGSNYADLFKVEERIGFIYTAKPIDREDICQNSFEECVVHFYVVADSGANYFKIITVNVTIDDVNDNSPVFDQPCIALSLSEAVMVGTSITIDSAKDLDTSQNYSLKGYRVSPSNSPFCIKSISNLDSTSVVQLVVCKALDREAQDFYEITVIAEDGDVPPRTGTLRVNITVTDENDNTPEFSSGSYHVSLNDNSAIGSLIMALTAFDKDAGRNAQVRYKLSPHQSNTIFSLFEIDAESGHLTNRQSLMSLPRASFSIIIQASDLGDPPLYSQTMVHVQVIHVHVVNSQPTIRVHLLSGPSDARAKVSEQAGQGTVVAHVVVEDNDSGPDGQITCHITSNVFALRPFGDKDSKEFNIVVNGPLDRELQSVYQVLINCHDNADDPLSVNATVDVELEDENDMAPVFTSKMYHPHMRENTPSEHVLLQIQAKDEDMGKNAEIRYLLESSILNYFNINPVSGVIKNRVALDREKTPYLSFVVYAVDCGEVPLTGSATVSVVIDDVNDETPRFIPPSYVFQVPENELADTEVGYLSAVDDDLGESGEVVFSMGSSPIKDSVIPFIVIPSGLIKTDQELNREVQDAYIFTVKVTDLGSPPLTSTANVKVLVTDKNDNAPVITSPLPPNNSMVVYVNTSPGTVVTRVRAFDLDEGQNGMLRYSIININVSDMPDLFGLHQHSGVVTLRHNLSTLEDQVVTVEVEASDMGQPRLFSRQTLFIDVCEKAGLQPQSSYFLVFLALVAVIGVGLVVVVIIVCVPRARRVKHKEEVDLMEEFFDRRMATLFLPDEDTYVGRRRNKKKVSFSFEQEEDEAHVSDHGGSLQPATLQIESCKSEDEHIRVPCEPDTSHHQPQRQDSHTRVSQQPIRGILKKANKGPWFERYQRPISQLLQTFVANKQLESQQATIIQK